MTGDWPQVAGLSIFKSMSNHHHKRPVIFLMGPTASGKTDLAIALSQKLPVDIISVDSAMVYRGMDIGTAKPSADELMLAPHYLMDICDPAEPYSAADFCSDAEHQIQHSHRQGRIPLLVGGTMMYFKALSAGLADMPAADPGLRSEIEAQAAARGWPALHRELQIIDPDYAAELHPNHSQRISRGLEVYYASGQTMSALRATQEATRLLANRYQLLQVALLPEDRAILHSRIEQRFLKMLEQGFIDEVISLRHRHDLHAGLPSMRAVGYRQLWLYLDQLDQLSTLYSLSVHDTPLYKEMVSSAVAATRQLAKRQLTWLRKWPALQTMTFGPTASERALNKKIDFIMNLLPLESL